MQTKDNEEVKEKPEKYIKNAEIQQLEKEK